MFGVKLTVFAEVDKVWESGDVLTAADLNGNFSKIDLRLLALENPSTTRVSLGNVTPFPVDSGVRTKILFSNELYDDKNEYDTSTNVFTPQAAGDYQFCALSTYNNINVASAELSLFVNGSFEKVFAGPGGYTAAGCRVVRLAAGDAVEVRTRQSSGSTLTVPADANYQWLTITGVH